MSMCRGLRLCRPYRRLRRGRGRGRAASGPTSSSKRRCPRPATSLRMSVYQRGGVGGAVSGHDPSGSPTKRLVQVGKYSFKSEDSEQSTSESPELDDETEKESISKRPIAIIKYKF